jgi:hypothetical protein
MLTCREAKQRIELLAIRMVCRVIWHEDSATRLAPGNDERSAQGGLAKRNPPIPWGAAGYAFG